MIVEGETVNLTIYYNNIGDAVAAGVQLTLDLPPGCEAVESGIGGAGMGWSLGNVAPGYNNFYVVVFIDNASAGDDLTFNLTCNYTDRDGTPCHTYGLENVTVVSSEVEEEAVPAKEDEGDRSKMYLLFVLAAVLIAVVGIILYNSVGRKERE